MASSDAGSFAFPIPVWTWIGGTLVAFGVAVTSWAGYTLRLRESIGFGGTLHTDGPYRYTRNP